MDVIKNCLITQSDAKVLREYCIDKSNPLYLQYKGYNTSVNLETIDVYNGYFGKVVMIAGDTKTGFEVVVQMNLDQAVKYGNLKSVEVKLYQDVDVSQKIGEAKKWLKFEYMTTNSKNQFPFRVGNIQMYKADPVLVLDPSLYTPLNSSQQYSQSGMIGIEEEFDDGFNDFLIEFDSDNGVDDDGI